MGKEIVLVPANELMEIPPLPNGKKKKISIMSKEQLEKKLVLDYKLPVIEEDTSMVELPNGVHRANDGSTFMLKEYGLDYVCPKHPAETIQVIRKFQNVSSITTIGCFQCRIVDKKIKI